MLALGLLCSNKVWWLLANATLKHPVLPTPSFIGLKPLRKWQTVWKLLRITSEDTVSHLLGNSFSDACRAHNKAQCSQEEVAQVMPPPSKEELLPFDLSPITPGTIRRTLWNRSSSSTPGNDGISYHHLKNMPSTHNFLATLFSKYSLGNALPQKCGTKPRSNLYQKARTLLFWTTSGPSPSLQL